MALFFILDEIMGHQEHSPSYFQKEIQSGLLTIDEIRLGLQNKCLNESYLYDINVSHSLMVVGEKIYKSVTDIDKTIDRMFYFSSYLTSKEILLLEKIRKKLYTYDYKGIASTRLGNQLLFPVNPSISYMTNNIFEIYQLYLQLQHSIYKNNYCDRNIFSDKVSHLYYSNQYKKCTKAIKEGIKKFPEYKKLFEYYSLLCDYKSDNKCNACKKLDIILKDKPHLVSYRGYLKEILDDQKVMEMLNQYYTATEIDQLKKVLSDENTRKDNFISLSKKLMNYYDSKSKKITQKPTIVPCPPGTTNKPEPAKKIDPK